MSAAPIDVFGADFFKALAHPVRINILRLLRNGEKSVTELQNKLGLESSSTSQQLSILRMKNLVTSRKEGTKVLYSIKDAHVLRLLDFARQIWDRQLIEGRALLDELEREEIPK